MKLKYGPYSPSRLEVAACGYRFHREYVKKDVTKQKTEVQDRGSAVHEVLDYMTNKIKVNPDYDFNHQEIRKMVAEAVNRNPAAYPAIDTILACAENYIRRPPKTLTQDAETELRLAIKYVDDEFVECDYDDEEAFARGRADIMMISDDTTTALVYDHKTQMNIVAGDTFQMGFYAWVISKIYPFLREVDTILHFSQYGHYSKPIRWMVRMSPEDIAAMPEGEKENCRSLMQVEASIFTEIEVAESRTTFEPTPNDLCQYCPLVSECPIFEDKFMLVDGKLRQKAGIPLKIVDVATAQRAGEAIHVIETYLKAIRKELSGYTKKTGAVALNSGIAFGYRPSLSPDWDYFNKKGRVDILSLLEKYGEDFRNYVGFSSTFSKNLLKNPNKALVAEINKILPESGSTKFGSYKL